MAVRTVRTVMTVRTRHSDDDILLGGSEDEEDAVEEDLDGDIDSMYDAADTGDNGQPENTDEEHSESGKGTDEEMNVFQWKDFTWNRTPARVAGAGRQNIMVRLPGCVCVCMKPKMQKPHMMLFHYLFLMVF